MVSFLIRRLHFEIHKRLRDSGGVTSRGDVRIELPVDSSHFAAILGDHAPAHRTRSGNAKCELRSLADLARVTRLAEDQLSNESVYILITDAIPARVRLVTDRYGGGSYRDRRPLVTQHKLVLQYRVAQKPLFLVQHATSL